MDLRDYFLIGDLHSAALVSKEGAIDWLCLPSFESPSVFGRLLDPAGGTFALEGEWKTTCSYEEDTAIVRIDCDAFTLHDFMPLGGPRLLVRELTAKRPVRVRFRYDPRPQYGQQAALRREGDMLSCGDLHLHLPSGARVDGQQIEIGLDEGQVVRLALEHAQAPSYDGRELREETAGFWRRWVRGGTYFPTAQRLVVRSAITCKLLQYAPTGGLVAAPTASLPEEIGGVRNWDYRYVWLRDATFTLYALDTLGCTDEADRFLRFIERTVSEHRPDLRLIYTVHGEEVPRERTLPWRGFRDSRPVRVGNDAGAQFQLDVYGVLIDAYYFMTKRGVPLNVESRRILRGCIREIQRRWMSEDNGIWEIRGPPQHYTYSKVMCWVGMDRAVRMAEKIGATPEEREEWQRLADGIRAWVWEHCFDEELGSFRQHPGARAHDASTLLFVPLQFLDRHDPRTRSIIDRTRAALAEGIMVYRYRTDDALPGTEGAFLLCTFWLIASLAAVGEHDEAQLLFSDLTRRIAGSGLMPEEMDPRTHEYLGNFPQAFSHMGLILAASYLDRYAG